MSDRMVQVLDLVKDPRRSLLGSFLAGAVFTVLTQELLDLWKAVPWLVRWSILGFVVLLLGLLVSGQFRGELRASLSSRIDPAKGLVVLISPEPGSATARKAIEHHSPQLRHLWLLYSAASRDAATSILQEVVSRNLLRSDEVHQIALSDAQFEDVEVVRDRIEAEVFARLPEGLGPGDVVIDITGGRKTTTAGAFLAGLPPPRRLELVQPKETEERLRGLEPGDPIEIAIDYKIRAVRRR